MKKLIIIAAILLLVIFGVKVYLNKIFLPQKIKALVVSTLSKQTGKNVTLKSLEFSFLKGLVLRDLVITDGPNVILSTRLASCTIFIWPIFKKQIIFPSVNLKAPYIYLERRPDKSFNLQDFFVLTRPAAKKGDFSLAVFKITISNGNIVFQDNSLPGPFKKEIKNIQLNLQLGLPVKFKFNLSAQLAGTEPVLINLFGEYKILSQELTGNLSAKGVSTGEFSPYYSDLGDLVSGTVDLRALFNLKNKQLQVNLFAQGDNLVLEKYSLKAKLNASLQSKINYNFETKGLIFEGGCDITQTDVSGLEFLGPVKNLSGNFVFNQRSLIADSIQAELMGLPFKIKAGIKDFSSKVWEISTNLDLNILPAIAKDKFKFSWIDSASGQAKLTIKMHPDTQGAWAAHGKLDITGANLKLDKVASFLEDVSGVLEFSQQSLSWEDAKFKYQGINYQSRGSLFDFSAPKIKLILSSDDLSVTGDLDILDKKIKIAQLKGKYLDSAFLISGQIDQADPSRLQADLTGSINLELSNLNQMLAKTYPGIKAFLLSGRLDTQFNLAGPLRDYKNCYLQAKSTSSNFSVSGFKATDFSLDLLQEQGIAKIPVAYATFYDGVIQGSGALNLNTGDLAYQAQLSASGINLEKLKNDTASKHKNIAGILTGGIKLNGAGWDLNKLDATGNFAVSHGRLGELNLLQGLGKLLLARDLGNIEFTACRCDFVLKDKFIYTDNFKLTSVVVDLVGPIKIGFDSSLEGALDVEIQSEMIPLDGTFKDVTTAIIGKGGKFGVIKLSGTLSEPKYNFKTAVGNIIQGLANVLFKK
ncbi:MAG TPA: DUF748 domain-containing protein [Candidatus Omnitrophota bacterium]|nr:DUF748 domain-containing protein [Candidatus Omnitrophota bacterium]